MLKRKRESDNEAYDRMRAAPVDHAFTRAATQDPDNVCVLCGGYPQTYGPCAAGFVSANVRSIRCCCSAMRQFIASSLG